MQPLACPAEVPEESSSGRTAVRAYDSSSANLLRLDALPRAKLWDLAWQSEVADMRATDSMRFVLSSGTVSFRHLVSPSQVPVDAGALWQQRRAVQDLVDRRRPPRAAPGSFSAFRLGDIGLRDIFATVAESRTACRAADYWMEPRPRRPVGFPAILHPPRPSWRNLDPPPTPQSQKRQPVREWISLSFQPASNHFRVASTRAPREQLSIPVTWVTAYTGDMGVTS